jgi:hypothetical protein
VRWTASARGAPAANARRSLDQAMALPGSLPDADVVIHEVLADEVVNHERRDEVLAGGMKRAHDIG